VRRDVARELRRRVRGEVRFDAGSRALYATDASNYRKLPIGVVVPRDIDDVHATLDVARHFGAPVLARGGGTSLAGQCCNVAIVIDFSKYVHRVLEIDRDGRHARVEPGCVLDDLRAAARRHGLTYGPDPSTHNHCTLGGMIGNNSCGVHSVMAEFYGPGPSTAHQVRALDVLTYDGTRLHVGPTSEAELEAIIRAGGRRGQIYRDLRALRDRYAARIRERFPMIPRRVSGYNLPELLPEFGFNVARALVGSEATCVTVLEAEVTLIDEPRARSLLVLGYPSVYDAGDHIPEIREHRPIGLEGLDDRLVHDIQKKELHAEYVAMLPDGGGWLLVEFGGDTKQDADAKARHLMERLRRNVQPPSMKLFDDPVEEHHIWKVRESGLGATARIPGEPDTWEGWEDSAVPPERVGAYLRGLRALFDRYGYACALYGHFGQGCVHTRIDFDLVTAAGIAKYRAFLDDAAELVLSHGGSLSGEHGDGQSRAELLPKMYGTELVEAFARFKAIWDPDGRMNPHHIVDPYRITEHLRLGTTYDPRPVTTHFAFREDDGSFARATTRCVGVGECRRAGGGTMCPSYMVTREEMHSTRGRAHLLFEMLQGEPLTRGWRDRHVREALDLCLACKGCKSECPVNVDMATYKAEFLAHYYARRLRPRSAYAMGLVYWWARAAALAPGIANVVGRTPILQDVVKLIGGIAPRRRIPQFAREPFTRWYRRRVGTRGHVPASDGERVILWPDTFNNHFFPDTARAAVEVLEAAGCRVEIPPRVLCCGRPLYDYGMLDLAKRMLRQILDTLRPAIRAGVPVVGLEPSCVSVFRDEMVNLLPHDHDAQRLKQQTFTLDEYLERRGWRPPALEGRAVVHGHCHHKSVLNFDAERRLLEKLGLDVTLPDGGCCGMAGSFGFESRHYDVSMAVGERVLLPAVRRTADETLIIADGFSCREQIAQATGRHALHLADVLAMAIGRRRGVTTDGRAAMAASNGAHNHAGALTAALLGAGALAVSATLLRRVVHGAARTGGRRRRRR
jgi:FAD/FMN-containing dehydrogenase/Fe-S oxidoreductase